LTYISEDVPAHRKWTRSGLSKLRSQTGQTDTHTEREKRTDRQRRGEGRVDDYEAEEMSLEFETLML